MEGWGKQLALQRSVYVSRTIAGLKPINISAEIPIPEVSEKKNFKD
jgi:hypothetical protein